ncbi:MAG: alanine racemase [Bacteroidales bacterium]|nr:alanine racemase [Bacteroidales bacterium]
MNYDRISTPVLVVNPGIVKSNIRRINEKCQKSGVLFRPHFKTHQSKQIGRWFRDEGISSIAVSSVAMARYFASDGWNDITVAFPYNPREHVETDALSREISLTLTIPSPESAHILASKAESRLSVMIKVDTGYNRSGTRWDNLNDLSKIIDIICTNPLLTVKGLLTHAGDTYKSESTTQARERYTLSVSRMKQVRDSLQHPGLMISVGDTPSASLFSGYPDIDELRAGNFVFYDLMQLNIGSCSFDDIAAVMVCPVVDVRHRENIVVIYGGAVHLSKDYVTIDGSPVYGQIVRLTKTGWSSYDSPLYLSSLSQEHGIIKTEAGGTAGFRTGELVGVIPVHSCLTADLAGRYLLTDGTTADHLSGTSEWLYNGQV